MDSTLSALPGVVPLGNFRSLVPVAFLLLMNVYIDMSLRAFAQRRMKFSRDAQPKQPNYNAESSLNIAYTSVR